MAKLTTKKYQEYKAINENGFKVNLGKLAYQFAHGDEYPQLQMTVQRTDKILLDVVVSFFKYYGGEGEYRIKASEHKIEGNMLVTGTGFFQKKYYEERTEKGKRFNLKYLKELCHKFNQDELKNKILKDYEEYKK